MQNFRPHFLFQVAVQMYDNPDETPTSRSLQSAHSEQEFQLQSLQRVFRILARYTGEEELTHSERRYHNVLVYYCLRTVVYLCTCRYQFDFLSLNIHYLSLFGIWHSQVTSIY